MVTMNSAGSANSAGNIGLTVSTEATLPDDGRIRRPLVLAAVAGFVLGCGLIGVLWNVSGVQTSSVDDAQAACSALYRLGDLPTPGQKIPLGAPVLADGVEHRMTAARELAAAAAEQNPAYRALSDDISDVNTMVSNLRFDDPRGQASLAHAKQLCARF
ncbi:MAG: hypothetical protein JWQ81_6247 [Amycolatopsis sp.]|jgi:hypothetical protein|uniref:hypothetical protein n=1 Tax=Amycolatopsis sp. TaxID=37632 RepID=UPI00260FD591|nr:hypothetical protein [Amycolatopsis sp.]MCU1685508.1 hypothetical protein [Amycolatopsis sp.]